MSKNINKFLSSKIFCQTPLIPFVPCLLTLLLLTVSFPVLDKGYLVWVSFVPWLILIKKDNKPVWSSLFIGSLFFLINLEWLRHVTYGAWILLSLYSMGYFVIFGLSASFFARNCSLPLTVVAPFLWVGLEYVRSFLMTGFPWLYLGHTQYQYLSLVQICDITGVYGVSFLIVLVNAAVAELVILSGSSNKYREISFYFLNIITPIVMLVMVSLYGYTSLGKNISKKGPSVTVVQGNILQSVKNDPDETQQIENLQKYINLSLLSVQEHSKADIVIWPETMAPGLLNINPDFMDRNIDRITQKSIQNLAYMLGSHLLIGGTAIEIEMGEQTFYNSAFYFDKNGGIIDRYDKIHLVPFGEFTPLKEYFPFLARLVPYEVSLSHGEKRTIFNFSDEKKNSYRFGALVCYEDTVPTLVREFVNDGVDFLVNMTNDGWFRKSAELDQHLAIMTFRAIENRVGMVRAANTGISAFIDTNGRIYDKLKNSDGEYKEIEGTLTNSVMINNRIINTWYTSNGDVFAVICIVVSGVTLFGVVIKRYLL